MDSVTKLWVKTKADEIAVANGCYFDLDAAEYVRGFIEDFMFVKPKKPFKLYDWQWEKIIAPIFGWKRSDGTRRFRVVYIEVPKKNGKSLMCAAISLALLIADGEYSAEVYNVAYTREQAKVVFREVQKLIKNSAKIKAVVKDVESTNTITFPESQSFIRVLSRDASSAEGKNIHGCIFDELHVQKNRDLYDALRYGGAARKQPLIISITTAGFDKQSVCWELHQQALNVNSGLTPQDDFYGIIFAADPEDDWTQEATWKKANPSYGLSINAKDFASECKEAQQTPAKEANFRRYRLCQWTEQESRWIAGDKWKACQDNYTAADLYGKACFLAVDLSISTAFTALSLCFPFEDGTYKYLTYFFLPKDTIEDMRGRLPYATWESQGHIIAIDGKVIDYDKVRAFIRDELGGKFSIQQIALDPFNAQNFETQLMHDGFKVYKMPQGMGVMSPLSKEFERLVLNQKIKHNAHPVLDWMMDCVTVKTDSEGNIKPVKPDRLTSTNQVDGVIASIMSLGLAIYRQSEANNKQKSVYESRGVLVF